MERLTLEHAAHALPAQPQRELDELGFTPAAACFADGPVLRFTDGDRIAAVLADDGGARVAFESVLADGTLLRTAPPDPGAPPPLRGCEHEVLEGRTADRLARHRERLGEEGLRLDADLLTGLAVYGARFARKPRSLLALGVGLPLALIAPVLLAGAVLASWPLLGVGAGMGVLAALVWAYDAAEGEPPGASLARVLGGSGRTSPEAVRDAGRGLLGQAPRRSVERTPAAVIEEHGFAQIATGESTRYHKGKARRYRRSTHLAEDGEVLVHLLERDGRGKWRTVLQSLHSDVVVETVVGGGLPEALIAHYRSEPGPAELDAALREHRRHVAERRVVPLHGKEAMVRGLANLVEVARGERSIHRAVRVLQIGLGLLLVPYLALTSLPEEAGVLAVLFCVWAAQQLVRPELAGLGILLTGEQLPEIAPRVIERLGKREEEEAEGGERLLG